jgi:hypothetical protein
VALQKKKKGDRGVKYFKKARREQKRLGVYAYLRGKLPSIPFSTSTSDLNRPKSFFMLRFRSLTRPLQTAFKPQRVPLSTHASESFLSGTNSIYAEAMLRQWKQDPSSVHAS